MGVKTTCAYKLDWDLHLILQVFWDSVGASGENHQTTSNHPSITMERLSYFEEWSIATCWIGERCHFHAESLKSWGPDYFRVIGVLTASFLLKQIIRVLFSSLISKLDIYFMNIYQQWQGDFLYKYKIKLKYLGVHQLDSNPWFMNLNLVFDSF